ncbi:MAG: methyltransferase domain-containing protein [Bacteroidota bacterium]|nr:tRNA (guanine-N(7)-)-methyltransferase [Candidatus Kapabacteria bacterium]MDW8219123.1 methyltransferase domain-containing protein [Bacteroidota bacterium]
MIPIIDYTKYPKPRSRHHVSSNQYLPRDQICIEPRYYPPLRPQIEWCAHFVNGRAPEYLDIGCGMGRFLLEMALREPSVNILGLEVREYAVRWIRRVIDGERPRGILGNAEALWYNVANGLPFCSDASIRKIFYLFPDPWFKKRHHYRRAFTVAFLNECARVLRSDGILYLMTDVPDVDRYQREILCQHGGFVIEECSDDAEWEEIPVHTDQEEFCLRKGIPYTRIRCYKRTTER